MEKSALVIDYKYCDGCMSCVIACRNEKKIPLEEWGVKVQEVGPQMVNGQWLWNFIPVLSSYCDLCEDRIDRGEKAACALHCLSACMEVVPYEKLPQRLSELGGDVVCYTR